MPHRLTAGLAIAATCLPLAATPLGAEMLSTDSREWRQLITMLGEPGEESGDFIMMGNSERIQLLLPGRWVIQAWGTMYDLVNGGDLERGCEFVSTVITASQADPYTFTATLRTRNGDYTTHSIVWMGNNNFTHQAHLGATLDRLGFDAQQFGMTMLYPTISRATTSWTYLPLDNDTILTTSTDAGMPMVMSRCDGEDVAEVSEQSLVDSCLAAVREFGFDGSPAEAASACGCIVTELMAADLDEALLASIQSNFEAGSDEVREIDRGLYERINDTCSP